ncbi:hypothetical protein [Algicola sagamiensis]|uniref:hypothetical protein n=1 Tax=Algicola sagamiensis TaxID=163869 RepID=UPI000376F665|nr:hypothetical protein [Algicola sagamiensis]
MDTQVAHRLTPQEMQRQQNIESLLKQNQHTFVQMNSQEFFQLAWNVKRLEGYSFEQFSAWVDTTLEKSGVVSEQWQQYRGTIKNSSGWIPVVMDSLALTAIAREMHRGGKVFAKYRIKMFGGNPHIIFEGYAGLRRHLTGTKYLASNPKVVTLGVGKLGAKQAIKGGFIISVIVSAAFHFVDQLFNDEKTWHDFVGGVAVDVAAGATAAATAIVTPIVGAVSMAAVGPLIAVVAVGAGLVMLTNLLIDTDSIANSIATSLRVAENNLKDSMRDLKRGIQKVERSFFDDPIGFMHRLFAVPQIRI